MSVPSESPKGKSLMNKTKRMGPRMEPCGTPEWTLRVEEDSLPRTTFWYLLFR